MIRTFGGHPGLPAAGGTGDVVLYYSGTGWLACPLARRC